MTFYEVITWYASTTSVSCKTRFQFCQKTFLFTSGESCSCKKMVHPLILVSR